MLAMYNYLTVVFTVRYCTVQSPGVDTVQYSSQPNKKAERTVQYTKGVADRSCIYYTGLYLFGGFTVLYICLLRTTTSISSSLTLDEWGWG